jgi:general secretion pathway protein J
MSRRKVQGFTLLEMLLALAVFSALSISAFQVLQGGISSEELANRKEQRLAELQRAFSQIEKDFGQIIPRRRRESERLLFAMPGGLQSDEWGVSFIRNSWQNPLGMLSRSELQSVGYRLRQQQLERLSYSHADHPPGKLPVVKVLLRGVSSFRLRFFANGNWQENWTSATALPQGIEVTLEVDGFGELTRLFLINEGATA